MEHIMYVPDERCPQVLHAAPYPHDGSRSHAVTSLDESGAPTVAVYCNGEDEAFEFGKDHFMRFTVRPAVQHA